MKKHIIIVGTCRSGKTILSMMLNKLGYTHYKMDSIKRGIFNNFVDGDCYNWEEISPKMVKLINQIIEDNKTDTNYLKEYYVIDVCYLYPKDIEKINKDDVEIFYLGYNSISVDEKYQQMRKYSINTWETQVKEQDLKEMIRRNIEFSRFLKEECNKYKLRYFDTSKNREEVLQSIYDYINKNNN